MLKQAIVARIPETQTCHSLWGSIAVLGHFGARRTYYGNFQAGDRMRVYRVATRSEEEVMISSLPIVLTRWPIALHWKILSILMLVSRMCLQSYLKPDAPTRELAVQRDLNTTDNIILHATRTGSRLPPGGLSRVRNPGMSVVFADRLLA